MTSLKPSRYFWIQPHFNKNTPKLRIALQRVNKCHDLNIRKRGLAPHSVQKQELLDPDYFSMRFTSGGRVFPGTKRVMV